MSGKWFDGEDYSGAYSSMRESTTTSRGNTGSIPVEQRSIALSLEEFYNDLDREDRGRFDSCLVERVERKADGKGEKFLDRKGVILMLVPLPFVIFIILSCMISFPFFASLALFIFFALFQVGFVILAGVIFILKDAIINLEMAREWSRNQKEDE